jgi:tocopherol cyclase
MECYHAVGSMDHQITGTARIGSATLDFTGGAGYLEKDWGTSMPPACVWVQSNTFDEEGVSFVFSLARIPRLRSSFPGLFAFLRSGGAIRRFASYTGAELKQVSHYGRDLGIDIEGHHLRLRLRASAAGKVLSSLLCKAGSTVGSVRVSMRTSRFAWRITGVTSSSKGPE